MVAPNSPKARVNDSTSPASIPERAFGKSTYQKIRHSDTPSVLAAARIFGSSCSKAPRAVRYMSGSDTTMAAMTAAFQVNTSVISNCSRKRPIRLRFPNNSSRKKPTTVGGRTSGSVMTASASPWNRRMRTTASASPVPARKVTIVAVTAVSSVMISGAISILSYLLLYLKTKLRKQCLTGIIRHIRQEITGHIQLL